MDLLAERLRMDPAALRMKNAICRGDLTPTGAPMDENTSDLPACLAKVKERLQWDSAPHRAALPDGKIRAKGISCFWKAPAIPTFTDAGAVLYFAEDGSATLSTGVIEIGQGAHDGLRMLVAEALKTDLALVRATRHVDTDLSPHDWATAASRSLFMAGRAVARSDAPGRRRRGENPPPERARRSSPPRSIFPSLRRSATPSTSFTTVGRSYIVSEIKRRTEVIDAVWHEV